MLDLRNSDERARTRSRSLHLPPDGTEDPEFWQNWGQRWEFGTPLYYFSHLDRMPERSLRVLEAPAEAPPGQGHAATLPPGVACEDIADDYMLSIPRFPRRMSL